MRLVHELEQLVNNSLEELPMCFEKARVLTHDVHDVGCDNGLVVLPALDLTKAKQVLDDSDQETLLGLLVYYVVSK